MRYHLTQELCPLWCHRPYVRRHIIHVTATGHEMLWGQWNDTWGMAVRGKSICHLFFSQQRWKLSLQYSQQNRPYGMIGSSGWEGWLFNLTSRARTPLHIIDINIDTKERKSQHLPFILPPAYHHHTPTPTPTHHHHDLQPTNKPTNKPTNQPTEETLQNDSRKVDSLSLFKIITTIPYEVVDGGKCSLFSIEFRI